MFVLVFQAFSLALLGLAVAMLVWAFRIHRRVSKRLAQAAPRGPSLKQPGLRHRRDVWASNLLLISRDELRSLIMAAMTAGRESQQRSVVKAMENEAAIKDITYQLFVHNQTHKPAIRGTPIGGKVG